MRKRMEELAAGKIKAAEPLVEFSVDQIEIEVLPGKNFLGEFTVSSTNRTPMRGMAYSSHPRMKCLTEGFAGEEAVIQYEFDSADLASGDICRGEFSIVCNAGEYTLSFAVSVCAPYLSSESGKIKNLADFAKLAEDHWQEAKKLFYAPDFPVLFGPDTGKQKLFYDGLMKGADANRSLEEFLLACRLKEQTVLTLSVTELSFSDVFEQMKETVTVTRNTWGYTEVKIKSDAPFLVPEKNRITSEDFLGKEAGLGVYVNPEQMHAGKNFGRLTLLTASQELILSVCAKKKGERTDQQITQSKIRGLHMELLKVYIEYRLQRIVTGRWALLSCGILDDLLSLAPDNVWYRLLKAQALWTNGQKQESEWILNEFKRKFRDRKSPQWGYYMYLCALMEHEELYISRLTEEIEQIYLENKESFLLFFCLLFLRKEYEENPYEKLKAIQERVRQGQKSPLLYVEAYVLYCKRPYLIGRLDEFEIQILNWACKQDMLTKSLADQMLSIFPERLPYRNTVFRILKKCYELMDCAKEIFFEAKEEKTLADDKRVLGMICTYLIRNQKYGKDFFEWYDLGVAHKLRITGLYEAYLMSMDVRSVQEVPKIIQMYFKYNNQLSSKLKAMLYVNMIANKKQQPEVFEQRYPAMVKFAYEQMELLQIDDNLAVVYEEALSYGIYSSRISDALSNLLFVHRLTCFSGDAVRVIVLQKQLKEPIVAPLVNKVAYVPLYSNDYSIFLEDHIGNRYSVGMDYQLEKLMHPGKYLKGCMQRSPQKLPYLLYYFADRKASEVFGEEDIFYFLSVLKDEKVDPSYKARLFPKLFRLVHEKASLKDGEALAGELEKALLNTDLSLLTREEKSLVLELCIEEGFFGHAYRMTEDYGCLSVPAGKRAVLVSNRIYETDGREDRTLLALCEETFFLGTYNDAMLSYLCRYYRGPIGRMQKIYESAESFGVDTSELAERMLEQMLYTGKFTEDDGAALYQSCEERGDKTVREAYLSFFSYRGFIEEKPLSDLFYRFLKNWQICGNSMNDLCGLALLSHYAKTHTLSLQDEESAEELLQSFLERGIYLLFYRQLPLNLIERYQLDDKYYIEYRTRRRSRVFICYQKETDEAEWTEEMAEVYEGIFVKKWILFSGEAIRYCIIEEADGQKETVKTGVLSCSSIGKEPQVSRYGRLSEMSRLKNEGNAEQLSKKMQEYDRLDNLVDVMFTVL